MGARESKRSIWTLERFVLKSFFKDSIRDRSVTLISGFSALVEEDGRRVLLDTGAHPDTVLQNARDLKIDLSDVKEVILTHNHWDHVGGLMTMILRKDDEEKSIGVVRGACRTGNLLQQADTVTGRR
jgi:metal-dependent hydrolase (beta-lactamase superfamily II)